MKSATPRRHATAYSTSRSERARARARSRRKVLLFPLRSPLRFPPASSLHAYLPFPPCRTAPRAHSLTRTVHVHCHAAPHRTAPHTRVDPARRTAETHVSSSSCFAASSSCRRFRCDLCGKDGVMGNLLLLIARPRRGERGRRSTCSTTRGENARGTLPTRTRARKSPAKGSRDKQISPRSKNRTLLFHSSFHSASYFQTSASTIFRHSLTRLLSYSCAGCLYSYYSYISLCL